MRCNEVIRELAAPTGDRDRTAMAEHLAGCGSCAAWARRAAQLDQLWEATSPPKPAPAAWDSVWSSIAQALDSSAPTEIAAPAPSQPSRNGSSPKVIAHPAPDGPRPAWRFRTGRLAALTGVGLAQAAAILIAVGLAWHAGTSSPERPTPPRVQDPNSPDSAVVRLAFPVKVEEGRLMVIRMEGPTRQVLIPVFSPGFSAVLVRAEGQVSVVDLTPEGEIYGVDDWYMVFNAVESIAYPSVASR